MLDFKPFLPEAQGGENAPFHYVRDVLDPLAKAKPEGCALLWIGPEGEAKTYTFAQIARDSRRMASALRAKGLAAGDTALLLLGDDPIFWPLMMALHRLGVAAAPVSAQFSREDVAYCLAKIQARAVFVAGEAAAAQVGDFDGQKYAAMEGIVGYAALPALMEATSDTFAGTELSAPDAEMLIYFTSGTTGLPLPVSHDFRYPLSQVETGRWLGLREGGLHLTIAGTGWSKSSWGKLYAPWMGGSALVVYAGDASDGPALARVLGEHHIDSFCAPPSVYRGLLAASSPRPAALQNATYTGEPMHPDLREQFEELYGLSLRGGYGQTEASLLLAQMPGDKPAPGALGRPVAPFVADVVDASGESCRPGVSGELVLRNPQGTPGMMRGYRGDGAETSRVWQDGLFHTGDVVWRDEWGCYWYVGRADDVIHSAGYRVGPYEVESVLLSHPAVRETAVYGVPDPLRFQIIKASVVLEQGHEAGDALRRALQDHVRFHTAPYKCPRLIEFVPELPHSINGKVRRGLLREEAGR